MFFTVTIVITQSRQKLFNNLSNKIHFTFITGQKVDQTSFIIIKTVM